MAIESPLTPLVQKYLESDPVTAAHTLETLSEEQAVAVLKSIPPAMSAKLVQHLPDVIAASLMQQLSGDLFKEIVENLEVEIGATIFLRLPAEMRQTFLGHLSALKKHQIQDILTYPENSAGRIMSTNFIAFHGDLTVRDVVAKLKLMAQKGSQPSYVYVVDQQNHFIGVLNMRDMLIADDDAPLKSVMRKELFSVNCFMDREQVAAELSTRNYFVAPVVDAENRLLGVVKAEQLIEDVQEEATEDLQKMFGAGADERVFSPFSFSLKTRLPWLYVNLATAFLAAAVVAVFQDLIARVTVLAVFLPIIAGQGGNAGAQSLAVVMRGIVMREIPPRKIKGLLFKEALIGLSTGILVGVVTAFGAWLWKGNPYLGLVIGLGMMVNMTVAALSGAAIPITMKALGLDPAQCSNIILTTITDVMGFFSFLGFALLFQSFLI